MTKADRDLNIDLDDLVWISVLNHLHPHRDQVIWSLEPCDSLRFGRHGYRHNWPLLMDPLMVIANATRRTLSIRD